MNKLLSASLLMLALALGACQQDPQSVADTKTKLYSSESSHSVEDMQTPSDPHGVLQDNIAAITWSGSLIPGSYSEEEVVSGSGHYEVYRNGTEIGESRTTGYTDTLSANGSYTYQLKAHSLTGSGNTRLSHHSPISWQMITIEKPAHTFAIRGTADNSSFDESNSGISFTSADAEAYFDENYSLGFHRQQIRFQLFRDGSVVSDGRTIEIEQSKNTSWKLGATIGAPAPAVRETHSDLVIAPSLPVAAIYEPSTNTYVIDFYTIDDTADYGDPTGATGSLDFEIELGSGAYAHFQRVGNSLTLSVN
jgi:hypothetical protein